MPNTNTPIAVLHHEAILTRIAEGERIADIATDYERTGPAISMALAKSFPEEYAQALRDQAEQRMVKYETQLECAPDGLSVSRARELLAHQRWKLERLHPERWGQMRQAVQLHSAGAATIQIISWAEHDTPT